MRSSLMGAAVRKREDGAHVYVIPSSGILIASTTKPLHRVVNTTAEYSSGAQIPWRRLGASKGQLQSDGLYDLYVDSEGWFYFFIGSDAEYDSVKAHPGRGFQLGGITNSP